MQIVNASVTSRHLRNRMQTAISASIWKAKGIKAIEFADYDQIYSTLAEWATYAINPSAYGSARVAGILGAAPPPTRA